MTNARVVLPNGIGMAQIGPSKNTRCERVVHMWLVRNRHRFTKHPRIPGMARRSADALVGDLYVFVHGRFWHDPNGKSSGLSERLRLHVQRNAQRDAETASHLRSLGLRHLIIWDDDLKAQGWAKRLASAIAHRTL